MIEVCNEHECLLKRDGDGQEYYCAECREVEKLAAHRLVQRICVHEYEWVDAGPYSDDIAYKVCKKCGQEGQYAYQTL